MSSVCKDVAVVRLAIRATQLEALRIAPESPEVLAMYGNLLRTTGASAAAVEFLSRATNFRRTCAITRANLGGALYESGRLIEAATELRTAVALSPHCAEAHNNLGNVLRDLGKLGVAIRTNRQVQVVSETLGGLYPKLLTQELEEIVYQRQK